MQYRVVLPKRVQKDLNNIDSKFVSKIKAALNALSKNPFIGKKLEGNLSMLYSYRIWPYRIIYEIIKKDLVVLIVRIGHRQSVYKLKPHK
jgi:mRNA interferase RelE/StbE